MKTAEEWYAEGGLNTDEAEIEHRRAIQADAEQSGYQRGFNEGRKQGVEEAYQRGMELSKAISEGMGRDHEAS